jgi:tetratricopeptide (TPR) repeat protein
MHRNFSPWLLVITLSIGMAAQGRPGTGGSGAGRSTGGGGNVSTAPSPRLNLPDNLPLDNRGPMFLSGKVTVEDGTPLTDPALIQSICKGNIRNEGYTDSKGGFSFDLNNNVQTLATGDSSDISIPGRNFSGSGGSGTAKRNLRDCQLQAVLPGFTSQQIELASKLSDIGTADVGTITLHRLQHVDGFTISATSALAPGKAKKEYDKGRDEEKKTKWDAAQEHFTKAVGIYPKYAVAWFELGRTQLQQSKVEDARKSFGEALAADAKFISPYEELAQLALKEKQWKDLDQITDRLDTLNPLSFPQYWFYNALANYFLQSYDKAEKSARQGLGLDPQHRIPRIEYVLGMILAQKHDFAGALEHVRKYLNYSPNASDLETVNRQIAELERLAVKTTSQNHQKNP